jgi:hypothetical protein
MLTADTGASQAAIQTIIQKMKKAQEMIKHDSKKIAPLRA